MSDIQTLIQYLQTNILFLKQVSSGNIPDYDSIQLPSLFVRLVSKDSQPPSSINSPKQLQKFSFVFVLYAPSDEQALEELLNMIDEQLKGFQLSSRHQGFVHEKGGRDDTKPSCIVWSDVWATSVVR